MKKLITLVGFMIVLTTLFIISCTNNDAPEIPAAPTGLTRSAINVSCAFKATTTDPNDDSIAYQFNWGVNANDTSAWSSFIPSGDQITLSRAWTTNDTFEVTVRAKDTHGDASDWSPSHVIIIVPNNLPPVPPMPSGPSSGVINVPDTFSTSTTDPDGDSVAYRFDWGNGDTSAWSVYYASGATALMAYTYTTGGTFYVSVQAKDQLGAITDWSLGHGITITNLAYPFTIALTWGVEPHDLDSHCWTPLPYHVYFGDKGALNTAPYCTLDVDDVTSYGPEHITISQLSSGTYKYAVHHWSGDSTIATSSAVVKIYHNGVLLQTFTPPSGTCQPFWYWYVFDIDGATQTITPVNTYSASPPGPVEKMPSKK